MYWIYRGAIYDLTQAPFRPGAERHETVQTRVKDPEGSARTEKTMRCKIGYNYLSVYIIGYVFTLLSAVGPQKRTPSELLRGFASPQGSHFRFFATLYRIMLC